MKKHECQKKNCRYFSKNEKHPYWQQKDKKKLEKKENKKAMESKVKKAQSNYEKTKKKQKKENKYKEYLKTLKKDKLIALIEQYRWEKDIALSQLKDLNLELGEKTYPKAITIEFIERFAKDTGSQKEKEYLLKLLKAWTKERR